VEGARIVGYATVAAGHLEIEGAPAALRRRLPRYPLPILRLARLAVDEATRGQGVGRRLLRHVFLLALRMASEYGCAGVVVDAKPGAVEFYEQFGFRALEVLEGAAGFRPVPLAMFLPLAQIAAALGQDT
jgi:predicted N-acetyltransferase YhbS